MMRGVPLPLLMTSMAAIEDDVKNLPLLPPLLPLLGDGFFKISLPWWWGPPRVNWRRDGW